VIVLDIGSRIKRIRKSQGLTASELAEKIEITREHLSAVENNLKSVSLSTLQKICEALDVSLITFFSEDDANLSQEYREVLQNLNSLTPNQLKALNELLKAFK
jgi:transcriptional regulator with XRE-family HTH domain